MRVMSLLLSVFVIAVPVAGQAQEAAAGEQFRVDGDASWLRVLVYPDGPLRRFGHNHVVSHNGISGTVVVASDPLESTIALELRVADLEVDDATSREQEGEDFEADVPDKDIAGTKANLFGEKLLQAEQFPAIRILSREITGRLPDVDIMATVVVRDMEQQVNFPASIELTEDVFVASGQLEITHAELGLSPFEAMGGALSVRDVLVLKYRISGQRVGASE